LPASKAAAPTDVAAAFAPQLKTIMTGLQKGEIDRGLFTANCNDYYDADALADYKSSLGPLGAVTEVTKSRSSLRGGMTFGLYRVGFAGGTTVLVTVYLQTDGKIEQLLVVGKG
jgi:hypothetical protein